MRTLVLLFVLLLCAPVVNADEYRLLRFRASWCQPCQAQKAVFRDNQLGLLLQRLRVQDHLVDIDTDAGKESARAWKVKTIPTTILIRMTGDRQAKQVKRWGDGNDPLLDGPNYRYFVDPKDSRPQRR